MLSIDNKELVIAIVGPTAVGKTDLSIELAEELGAEIVSADSRQVYRRMDIGTAKPSPNQLKRIPHHLIDIVEPDEVFNLAMFQTLAKQAINEIFSRGKLPILVGGTGQYVRALVQGWLPPVMEPDLQLRSELEETAKKHGGDVLFQQLLALDPDVVDYIDPRNTRRVIRALEVVKQTGKPFSSQRLIQKPEFSFLQIGLTRPRPELYVRIDQRIDGMIEAGLMDEVRNLLAEGCPVDAPSMSAIGYREMVAVLHGEYSVKDAVKRMGRASRNYVRRQANWFSLQNPEIYWFSVHTDTLYDITKYLSIYSKVKNNL